MRDQWCAVTDGQIPLVRLLVDHFGVVVRDEQVDEVFVDAGTSAHEEAIKTTVRRVSQTLGRLGLRLQRVRGAGTSSTRCPDPDAHEDEPGEPGSSSLATERAHCAGRLLRGGQVDVGGWRDQPTPPPDSSIDGGSGE